MKLQKLDTINERQYKRLLELGLEVTMETPVLEVLKFVRSLNAMMFFENLYRVRVHESAYFVSEVYWHGEIDAGTSGWISWHSMGVHSWEGAESLALDYILGTLEMPELHNR